MAYLVIDEDKFKHMHRLLNTNIDGKQKVAYALTAIKGVGRRFSHVVCKKAGVDLRKRAGELTEDEVEEIKARIEMPLQNDIPAWMLNRRKDRETGDDLHNVSSDIDTTLRNDIERMKKIRLHRGLRHYWNVRVRGQHTNATGRHRQSATGLARAGTLPK